MLFTNLFRGRRTCSNRSQILLAPLVALAVHCLGSVDTHAIPLTNLKVWLRADAIEGASDGDPVAIWADQSGNSNNAEQERSSNRPTYQTSKLNGLPTVMFDGLNDHLVITSNADLEAETLSAFAVVVPTARGDRNGRDVFGKYFGPDNPYASYAIELIDGERWRMSGSYNRRFTTLTSPAIPFGEAEIMSGIWNNDPSMALFVDGTEHSTRTTTDAIRYNGEPLTIGAWLGNVNADNSFGGDIAEFLFYDTALSTNDRQLVEGSLAWKYGLQDQLPTDHPYLSSPPPSDTLPLLQPGDADQDLDFDQLDLVEVQIAAKYLSGQAATWGEGDWNGAPGGQPGKPPIGNGFFDQIDVIAALGTGIYLTGPYGAISPGGAANDGQTSIGYNPETGEVFVDAPAGTELTSINIDSVVGIFTGAPAANLGGSFDNDADNNVFKATFGGSFGSLSLGNVAQTGLSAESIANDLTVVGSLAGGGGLGDVDLVYVPECSAIMLLLLGGLSLAVSRRSQLFSK